MDIHDGGTIRTVGVPRAARAGERRVAVTPAMVPVYEKAGLGVIVERGAGAAAGFLDDAYRDRGATLAGRDEVFERSDLLAQIRVAGPDERPTLRPGQIAVGLSGALDATHLATGMAASGATVFGLELLPRITRAQSMDVLSSQATVAGYAAVLVGSARLAKMLPMMTTAAGTVPPSRTLVVGAGVAGLQAIATARRLGAVVEAYDVRQAAAEDVESLGARFVELPLNPGDAEDASGYAKALGESFYRRQRELLGRVVSKADLVVCTALLVGRPAPVLVTADAVRSMGRGSVVVDLAAEKGGNCEVTEPDEEVLTDEGVLVLGPTNLASATPATASQLFAKNVSAFVLHVVREGVLTVDSEDPIATQTLVCRAGAVVNKRVVSMFEEHEGRAA